jgi:hypothetical protein
MSKNVFANGMEVSSKSDDNKSICAMPDVCLSPPSPPAGPLPIPYPNTAQASDTSDGSKTVQIGGAEVGMKNSSNYKKSSGDEAATKSLGMGVVTHTIQGKLKHAAWSFDVKVDGDNAIRHMDMTTHNHMNCPNMAMILNQAAQNMPIDEPWNCEELDDVNTQMRGNSLRPSASNGGYTVTTASYTGPGGSVFMPAATPMDLIRSNQQNGFAPARPGNQTMACCPEQWGAGGNNNHTEPKLIEQIFTAAGNPTVAGVAGSLGSLVMSIFHCPGGNVPADNIPCPRCATGICKAIECGLDIKICDEGEPTEPNCPPAD